MSPSGLRSVLEGRDLVICVGAGGVGKTTTAAAIALRAARMGRKVLVLTIDPAKRLANSLGLARFGNEETRIDVPGARGELWAMMLDNRRTFDDLIRRVAPDEDRARRILENRIYRAVADNIAGSQDYMATEKLHDLARSGRYDLVVLDTPPVKNALDFLEAPGRLARFLERRIMRWFLTPYDESRVFGRLLLGTSAVVFRLLGFLFGRDFLGELSGFFQEFRDLYEGFRDRHAAVLELFAAPTTAFVVVCAPTPPAVEVAEFFLDELRARGLPCAGVVVNRRHLAHPDPLDPEAVLGPLARERAERLPPDTASRLLARLGAAHERLRRLSALEARLLARLRASAGPELPFWTVPRLEREVHDIGSLDEVGRHLFADGAAGRGR